MTDFNDRRPEGGSDYKDALPGGVREHWESGSRAHFEYHCYESHDSGDAQAWYRSHRPVTVVRPHGLDETDYLADEHGPRPFHERAAAGMPRTYEVRWDDGYKHTAWEDELLVHPRHFTRPDPPDPPNLS